MELFVGHGKDFRFYLKWDGRLLTWKSYDLICIFKECPLAAVLAMDEKGDGSGSRETNQVMMVTWLRIVASTLRRSPVNSTEQSVEIPFVIS